MPLMTVNEVFEDVAIKSVAHASWRYLNKRDFMDGFLILHGACLASSGEREKVFLFLAAIYEIRMKEFMK